MRRGQEDEKEQIKCSDEDLWIEQLSTLSSPPVKGISTQQGRQGDEEEGFTPTRMCSAHTHTHMQSHSPEL